MHTRPAAAAVARTAPIPPRRCLPPGSPACGAGRCGSPLGCPPCQGWKVVDLASQYMLVASKGLCAFGLANQLLGLWRDLATWQALQSRAAVAGRGRQVRRTASPRRTHLPTACTKSPSGTKGAGTGHSLISSHPKLRMEQGGGGRNVWEKGDRRRCRAALADKTQSMQRGMHACMHLATCAPSPHSTHHPRPRTHHAARGQASRSQLACWRAPCCIWPRCFCTTTGRKRGRRGGGGSCIWQAGPRDSVDSALVSRAALLARKEAQEQQAQMQRAHCLAPLGDLPSTPEHPPPCAALPPGTAPSAPPLRRCGPAGAPHGPPARRLRLQQLAAPLRWAWRRRRSRCRCRPPRCCLPRSQGSRAALAGKRRRGWRGPRAAAAAAAAAAAPAVRRLPRPRAPRLPPCVPRAPPPQPRPSLCQSLGGSNIDTEPVHDVAATPVHGGQAGRQTGRRGRQAAPTGSTCRKHCAQP